MRFLTASIALFAALIPSTAFACYNAMVRASWTETYPLDYLAPGAALAAVLMLGSRLSATAARRGAILGGCLFAGLGLGFACASDIELHLFTGYTFWTGMSTIGMILVARSRDRSPRLARGLLVVIALLMGLASFLLFDERAEHERALDERPFAAAHEPDIRQQVTF